MLRTELESEEPQQRQVPRELLQAPQQRQVPRKLVQAPQKRQVTKELLQACLRRCEHDILTASDIAEILSLWSKRTWFYWTDYSQATNILDMFINGHGYIETGGFNFQFRETNSFDIEGDGWSLHISNLALLLIICLIFGLCAWVYLVPGASAASIALGSFSLKCCLM